MSLLVLCGWSSLILVTLMLVSKFRWTATPLAMLAIYGLAGVLSTLPAALTNNLFDSRTQFFIMSPDPIFSSLAFFFGAGIGEEFYKFSAGLLVTLFVIGFRQTQSPATRMLGFVAVGLGFAIVENFYYSPIGFHGLMSRNVTAVPLHATMGFIQGAAVNRMLAKGNPLWIFVGYIAAVSLHTFYDILARQVPVPFDTLVLGVLVLLLLAWAGYAWQNASEISDLEALEPDVRESMGMSTLHDRD